MRLGLEHIVDNAVANCVGEYGDLYDFPERLRATFDRLKAKFGVNAEGRVDAEALEIIEAAEKSWCEPQTAAAPPPKPARPSLSRIVKEAKKAGATAVTIDNVTFTLGEPRADAGNGHDTDRELAEFEARHVKA